MDTVIQKAVECGVREIIPFESDRCVVKMKAEGEARKKERRGRIAAEAAKQCGRSVIPTVSETVSFREMLRQASRSDLRLFCYEGDGTHPLGRLLRECDWKTISEVSIVIGSEGGFSVEEAKAAAEYVTDSVLGDGVEKALRHFGLV